MAQKLTSDTQGADGPALLVTPDELRSIAGDTYFDRGKDYFSRGKVRSLVGRNNGVMATVRGTDDYHVRLTIEDGDLFGNCSCPLGEGGSFCKHCVATGLAWHAAIAEGRPPLDGEADVESYLDTLEKKELIKIILDRARTDPSLDRRLTLSAAQATGGPAGPETWKSAFHDALEQAFDAASWSSDWRYDDDEEDYADELVDAVEALDVMLRGGDARLVVEFAEYAIRSIDEAMEHADGMDGFLDGAVDRLARLHLDACNRAGFDPTDLARRLFDLAIGIGWSFVDDPYVSYADALGEDGRAEYRRRALAHWADQGARAAGGYDPLAGVVEAIAIADGDTGLLVEVKSGNLKSERDFLVLARSFDEAGDADAGLAWAERGWKKLADDHHAHQISNYLVEAYEQRGRHDEAMALVWQEFDRQPCLASYRKLELHAIRADQWPLWREKALGLVRRCIAGGDKRGVARLWPYGASDPDNSLLVDIFLHEDAPDAAWREAVDGGCSPKHWLALAARRKETHPWDAIDIYRRHAEFLLQSTGEHIYRQAMEAMEAIEAICLDVDEVEVFPEFVARIRKEQKRKRLLMGMMDERGW